MTTIYDMLAWAGFYTDKLHPHVEGFWSTPAGLFISFSMFVCAMTNVFHNGIDDGLFDRIFYCAIAMVMLCAFLVGINPGTDPKNIVRSVVFLVWIKMYVEVCVRLIRYRKTGRVQKTL